MRDEPRYAGFKRFLAVLMFWTAFFYGIVALHIHEVIDITEYLP